jgi:hypothetical protein
MRPGPFFLFRLTALVSALTLGILALWIVGAESLRPHPGYFPGDAREAQAFAATRQQASGAALIGMVRGDLWTALATAEAARILFETDNTRPSAVSPAETERATIAAVNAVKFSPHDSRNWLVLAGLANSGAIKNQNAADALKLSYFTGAVDPALAPLRLSLATRLSSGPDEDLKSFVELEIRQLMVRQPNLKPVLASIYAKANPSGRKIMEDALAPADKAFLDTLKRS